MQDNFKGLINEAGLAVEKRSFQHLNKARKLIAQLTKSSSEIAFNQKRLEIIEKTLFVVEFSFKSVFVFGSSTESVGNFLVFIIEGKVKTVGYQYKYADFS